jgi:hypothetical protein
MAEVVRSPTFNSPEAIQPSNLQSLDVEQARATWPANRGAPRTTAGSALLNRDPLRAVEFDILAKLVDLDAEAIELDFMLPIVAGRYRLGTLGVAGLDELVEHVTLKLWTHEA